MENKDQNSGLGYSNDGVVQPPPSLNASFGQSDSNALSLDVSGQPLEHQASNKPSRANILRRLTRRADVVLAVLLVLSMIGVFIITSSKRGEQPTRTTGQTSNYATQHIPLDDFTITPSEVVFGPGTVSINGAAQLNGGLVVSPSVQPSAPKAGQIYFDQQTSQFAYYNGAEFVALGSGVESIQGITGQVSLGGGLAAVGNQLVNAGVLSLGGQTGTIVLGNGLNLNGNVLQNTGVLNLTAGSGISVTNNGSGSFTVANTGAGSGTVASSGGTAGRIPLFTGAQNIENSLLTQSGLTVTVNGDLSVVTGGLSLSNALTVSNGGTGTTSLAANGVLVGNGTSPISSVTAGGSNLCLLSTAGAPIFAACPSASGVTTLNGLSGAVSIANASGAGGVVTIDDASTSTKGIAQFDATNFDVAGGLVNTKQDINTSATPTFAGLNTNNITPSGALTVGAAGQTALLQGSTVTVTSNGGGDIVLTSSDQIRLTGFDCSTFSNGGTLTTDASGNLACANDDGGSSAVNSINALIGDLTLQGTTGQIAVNDNGTDTLTLSLDSAVTLQGNSFNAAGQLVQLNGSTQLPAVSGALLTNLNGSAIATGTVANNRLVNNGELTVTAGTGLTGGGSIALGGSTTLNVVYGAVADTAVEGDIQITVTAGTNLTGGGTLTLGAGGSVTVDVADSPTFAGDVAVQGSNGITIGTAAAAGLLVLHDGNGGQTTTLQAGNSSGNLTFVLPVNAGSAAQCLKQSGTGNQLVWDDCEGGAGGVSGVTSLNSLSGTLTVQGTANRITVNDNGTDTITISTPQDIHTAASPQFAGLTLSGDLAVNGGYITSTGGLNITPGGALVVGATGQALTVQGNATTTITATDSGNTTSLVFATPTADNTITFPDASGVVCLNTGNCVGVGGGVTTPGGTAGTIAIFTDTQEIDDSIITQTGGNTINIAGTLTLTNALGLAYGGTGLNTTTPANGQLLIGNGSGYTLATLANNGGLTISNGAGSIGLAVNYGSSANTAVEGDTTLTCPSGTGNLTGGGNSVTLGAGGSCNSLDTVNNPTFSTSVTTPLIQGASLVVSSTGANPLELQTNGSTRLTIGASGDITATGDMTLQGGALMLGTNSQAGGLVLNDGNGQTTTLLAGDSSGDLTFVLPTGAGTDFQCLKKGTGNQLIWDDCEGGSGGLSGVTSFNTLVGDLTLQGTTGQIAVNDNGTDTLTLSLDSAVTLQGNSFNAAGQLVQLNGSTQLPAVSGALLTNLNGSAIATGTVANNRLVNNGELTVTAGTNLTGGGSVALGGSVTLNVASSPVFSGTLAVQGASVTVGGAAQLGSLILYDGSSNTGTLSVTSLGSNRAYTLPDQDGEICLDSGNCPSSGNVSTTGGTAGTIAVFTDTNELGDSLLSQDTGTGTVTVDGHLNLTAGNEFRINGVQISSANLSNDSNLVKLNASQTFTGNNNSFRNGSDSANGFSIQRADGVALLTADTTAGAIVLGAAGSLDGSLVFNTAGGNSITILPGTPTDDRIITLPDESGTICLSSGNCAGAGATLQTAYNFSTGGTTPKIKVNDTKLGVSIQDADTSITDYLFTVRASNDSGLGQVMFGVNSDGDTIIQSSANSATALQLLTDAGTSVLTGDTDAGRVVLGQGGTLDGTLLFQTTGGAAITLVPTATAVVHSITLPNATGTVCLTSGNCAGVGGTGDILQGGNNFGTAVTIGTNDAFDLILERQNAAKVTIGANNVTLASDIDLLLQGANAFISNPQTGTDSEAFGAGAWMGNGAQNALSVGANAFAVTDSVAIGTSASTGNVGVCAGTSSVALGASASTCATGSTALGHNSDTGTNANSIAIGNDATTTAANQLVIGSNASPINHVVIGSGVTNGTPVAFTLQGTSGSGNDVTGATLYLSAGQGTGSADGGDIQFQTSVGGLTGSTLRGLTTVGRFLGGTGSFRLQNAADNSDALRVEDTSGASLLTVDTTTRSGSGGNLVKIGNSTGTDGALTILQLDSSAADPTSNLSALNGGLFYNSTTNKVSLIENGVVKIICNTTDLGCGTGTVTLQSAYNNSTNPEILLGSASTAGLTIRDNATPISGNLLEIQDSAASTAYLGLTTAALTLGTDVDLTLQGANAFISNPQGQTGSESFGAAAEADAGNATAIGNLATASSSGSTALGKSAWARETQSTALGNGASSQGLNSVALGSGATVGSGHDYSIAIGTDATTTTDNQLVIGSSSSFINQVVIGNGVQNATPTGFTLQGTNGTGSDISGADVTIAGGQGTGTGNGGNINFQIADPGSTGSSLNSLATVLQLSGSNGSALFKNTTDSSAAFQIQNASSDPIFNVDTSSSMVTINGSTVGSQGFEGVTFPPASPGTWTTGGDANWARTTGEFQEGAASAASGNIVDGEVSWLDLDYTFATDGVLRFNWKIDAEGCGDTYCDPMFLLVDNDASIDDWAPASAIIGGDVDWQEVNVPVKAGAHSFRWVFFKDDGGSVGADTAWIDNVRIVEGGLTVNGAVSVLGLTVQDSLMIGGDINVGGNAFFQNIHVGDVVSAWQVYAADDLHAADDVIVDDFLYVSNGAEFYGDVLIGTDSTTAFRVLNGVQTDTVLSVDTDNSRVGINTDAPSADLSFGDGVDRTINVVTAASGTAGNALTVQAGNAGSGGVAADGGTLTLQAGDAAGTGNADGGNIVLQAGNDIGSGDSGRVLIRAGTGQESAIPFFEIQDDAGTSLFGVSKFGGINMFGQIINNAYDLTFSNDKYGGFSGNIKIGSEDAASGEGDGQGIQLFGANSTDLGTEGGDIVLTPGSGPAANGIVLVQGAGNAADAFKVQNAAGDEVMFTIDTNSRSGSGGNLVKIGNSTGTDGALTILQLDGSTADPTSNLAALNGGLFYNSTTHKVSIIENGQVKVLCNKIDLGCGAGATTSLQDAYEDSTTPASIVLNGTNDGLLIQNPSSSGTDSGYTLFVEQLNTGSGTEGLRVSTAGTATLANFVSTNTSGTQTNGLLLNRNGVGGTTTNGINITNTAGTLTNGLAFTGTIGTDIQRASGTLSLNGASGITLASGGSTKATVGANDITLASNIDLLLQGATAYISNPKGQTGGEAFGLNASVSSSFTLAVGNNADASSSGATALGESAFAQENDSIAIGSDSHANAIGGISIGVGSSAASDEGGIALGIDSSVQGFGAPVAIGDSASAENWGVAVGQGANNTGQYGAAFGNGATAGFQSVALGAGAVSGSSAVAIGLDADASQDNSIAIGKEATTTATNQLVIGSSSFDINHVVIGNGVINATPTGFTLQGTSGSGTDVAGASVTIAGGQGTGTGNGGNINFQIADPGTTGSSLNSLATVMSLQGSTGAANFQNSTNSNTAFQVQNVAGTSLLKVDSLSASNEVRNADFENGNTNGWSLRGSASDLAASQVVTAKFGRYSLRLRTQSAANNGVQYKVGLKPSTTYSLSLWARRETGSSSASFQIGRADNGTDTNCLTGQTFTTTWTQFTCSFTTGSTIGSNANIYVKQSDTSNDDIYIDGVTLYPSSSAVSYATAASGLEVAPYYSNVKINVGNNGDLQPWTINNNSLLEARSRPGATTYNGYVYVVGGGTAVDGGTVDSTGNVMYAKINADGSLGTFATTTNLGTAVSATDVVAVNGYLYVVGGTTTGAAAGAITTVQYAKIKNDGSVGAWQTATAALPDSRAQLAVVAYNGFIYAIGGSSTGSGATSTSYYARVGADGNITAWTTGSALNSVTSTQSAAAANGYMYVVGVDVGGGTRVEFAKINADGSLGSYQTSSSGATFSLPNGRGDFGIGAMNGYIYVIGGWDGSSIVNTVYYASLNSDGSTGSWITGQNPLPAPRENHRTVTANGYLYVIGGDTSSTQSSILYTSGARVQIAGALDLVGTSGQNLNEGGATGGELTAGNTNIIGSLRVQESVIIMRNLTANGAVTIQNGTDSTSAFAVLNASTVPLFNIDSTNGRVQIGSSSTDGNGLMLILDSYNGADESAFTSAQNVNGAMYYNSTTHKFRCYENGAWVNCIGSGAGGGSTSQTMTLIPEYEGAVITADGSDNNGTMISDFLDGLGSGAGYKHNFYEWTTSQGTSQDYDIVINHKLPNDFDAITEFDSGSWKVWTYVDSNAGAAIAMTVYDNDGTACANGVSIEGGSTGWTQITLTDFDGNANCDFTANSIITIRIKMTSVSPSSNKVRVGEIQYAYTN